jgi:hypothetical protein
MSDEHYYFFFSIETFDDLDSCAIKKGLKRETGDFRLSAAASHQSSPPSKISPEFEMSC